jgi:MFS superfamily sulfate permease-like transporter
MAMRSGYFQIASLSGFTVAALCAIAWLFRLSTLVKLISDSVLVGFKAGAGLTIAMTQLPPPRSAVTLDVDQVGKRLR